MLIGLLFQLFVFFFNNISQLEKKIYFELSKQHKLVLNVSNIYIEYNTDKVNNDCHHTDYFIE